MPDAKPPAKSAEQIGLLVGLIVVPNLIFYFLSDRYYAERAAKHGAEALAGLNPARIEFLVFSLVTVGGFVASLYRPKHVGHLLAGAMATLAVVGGSVAQTTDLTPVLGYSLLAFGLLFAYLVTLSWKGSRAGWAFLVGGCATFATIMMFAAPKMRALFHVGLWLGMIVPGLLAAAVFALARIRTSYQGD